MKSNVIKKFFCGLAIAALCAAGAPAQAKPLPAIQESGGKTYLLSIGIDEYIYLPRMRSCVNNATLIAQTFQNSVKNIEVTLWTDKQATKDNFVERLKGYQNKLAAADRLIIYYSGHGGKNTMYWSSQETSSSMYRWREDDVYDEGIMLVDASYSKDSQLAPAELSALLKALAARQIVIIVDSSYSSSPHVPGSLPSFQSVSQTPRPRYSIRDLNMYGMTIINSSDWKETAREKIFKGKRLGVFTYYFAQGMATHSLKENKGGTLSLNKIFEYSRMLTMQDVGVQKPQMYRGRERDMVLSAVGAIVI